MTRANDLLEFIRLTYRQVDQSFWATPAKLIDGTWHWLDRCTGTTKPIPEPFFTAWAN